MKYLYIYSFFLLNFSLFSQSNIVVSGGNVASSTGSISYSVGQIDYISVSGSGGTLSQGNQQAFEIFENTVDENKAIKLSTFVYPNPTNNFVLLKIEGLELSHLNYKVFDAQGKEIVKNDILNTESKISFISYATGTYFLRVYKESTEMKSFKIIKNL